MIGHARCGRGHFRLTKAGFGPSCPAELRFVHSGRDLVRALDEARCQILIVEVHFNESVAVAALSCAFARDETFPVICVRDVPAQEPGHVALNALRMPVAGVVVRDFIDLVEHRDDDIGNAQVRARFERLLEDRA